MNQEFNKIFWRIGQEITPETFIQSDNYVCRQHNLLRRLIADKCHGLMPYGDSGEAAFMVKANLNNKELSVEQLVCSGATSAGYFADISNKIFASLPKKYVSIPDFADKPLYIVLRINPFEQVLIEPVILEEAPEAHASYELNIRELDNIGEDELAIIKVDSRNHTPEINSDYIPPCMSINACSKLLETYKQLKHLLTDIQSHVEHKGELFGATLYPIIMLQNELDEFPLSGQPIALLRLIRKIILTYRFFVQGVRTITLPDFLRDYNHNDMSITFNSLLSYLQSVMRVVSEGIEEDFTPRI